VATLRVDEEVDAVFACTRKERQISRTGAPYLNIELRDSTGSIVARAFRDADMLAGRFDRGELVRVRGRVGRFREQLQLDVRSIDRAHDADSDPAAVPAGRLPGPRRARGLLRAPRARGVRPGAQGPARCHAGRPEAARGAAPRAVLDARPAGAGRSPSSSGGGGGGGGHHAYLGGMLEHTVAVATMALELCTVHQRLDRDLLLCAALVHDLAGRGSSPTAPRSYAAPRVACSVTSSWVSD